MRRHVNTYRRRYVMRQRLVHAGVFVGICVATYLQYHDMHEAAVWVSLGANGVWVFHG
jgi:hypothetical protein